MNSNSSKEQDHDKPASLSTLLSRPIAALVLVSLVSNLLMLTGPLFMLQVYDRVLTSGSLPTLTVLTALIVVLYGFYAGLDILRSRMSQRVSHVIDGAISSRLFEAAIRLRILRGSGNAPDPIGSGDTIRQFLSGSAPLALLDLPWVPIYLAIIFLLHPWLGWLAIGGAAIIIALMIGNELSARKPSQRIQLEKAKRARFSSEAVNNADTVVAMGMLKALRQRWTHDCQEMRGAHRVAGDRAAYFTSSTKALRFLLQSLVLALGAYLVIHGEMTGGLMIAASVMTSRALAPVEQVVTQWRTIVAARDAMRTARKILAAMPDGKKATTLPDPERCVALRHCAVGPAGSNRPVVSNVTFALQAGDAVGVLGPSGAGKSSLAKALAGIWPVMSGEIRFDSALLDHYDEEQWGRIIGYLPQRVELFSGTVAQNIARFQSSVDSDAVLAAARHAGVHELINQLPDGYDTEVGSQGSCLSAGQQQRIGLARALYGDPFMLILDEPNSNLDEDGDLALDRAIAHARERGAIVFVIAHRKRVLSSVNLLLCLQNGRQIAFGPRDEILGRLNEGRQNVSKIQAVPA